MILLYNSSRDWSWFFFISPLQFIDAFSNNDSYNFGSDNRNFFRFLFPLLINRANISISFSNYYYIFYYNSNFLRITCQIRDNEFFFYKIRRRWTSNARLTQTHTHTHIFARFESTFYRGERGEKMASEGEHGREADKIWENGWWWFCRERRRKLEAEIEIQSGVACRHAQYGKCTTRKKKKKRRKNKKRKKFILCESEDKNGENKESRGIWEVRMHDKWKMKLATYSEGVS